MKTLKMHRYRTTEEADKIYQLLEELKEANWQAYGGEIQTMSVQRD